MQELYRIETDEKGRKTTREGERRRIGCQREDQELTKTGAKK